FGRKPRDRALKVTDAGQMRIHAHLIFRAELLLQQSGILPGGLENTALAIYPALFSLAEEPVEEPVRNHLRRQSTLVSGPAHIPLHAFAEAFLRHADLKRS